MRTRSSYRNPKVQRKKTLLIYILGLNFIKNHKYIQQRNTVTYKHSYIAHSYKESDSNKAYKNTFCVEYNKHIDIEIKSIKQINKTTNTFR